LLPTIDHRRTEIARPKKLHGGLDAIVHGWIGRAARRPSVAAALHQRGKRVHSAAAEVNNHTDAALKDELTRARQLFRRGGELSEPVVQSALAAIAETANRRLGLRPHMVQLMGALAVWRGMLLEMATGEGKTLTVGLASVLAGWTGRPCHVITANDYLAARDAAELAAFYRFCGLSVGAVTSGMQAEDRRENYRRDITYTTSKEVVADFLRDRLQLGQLANSTRRLLRAMLNPSGAHDGLVLRGLHTAIVDEADSALIDEAVTPLIISRQQENEQLRQACAVAHRLSTALERDVDYSVDSRRHEVALKPTGLAKLQQRTRDLPGMWRGGDRRCELVCQALRAREFFHLGKQYVVEEGKIVIVDEFTGRLMPQRTWREGLHQAVEAKEGLEVTTPAETLARVSFQRFFRFYRKLSGLSGTVWEAGAEVWHIYGLPIARIPTNKPCIRVELPDRIFPTQHEKWSAIVEEIIARHRRRQPMLVGTRSVAASENLAAMLESRQLPFRLLNATRHKEEAAIVAEAGMQGRITIATNMAGRGTDIKLGPLVAEIGGLHVILTERHESRRIDRQLMGRAARQGDPGSAQAFVSLEDELPLRHLPGWLLDRARAALASQAPGGRTIAAAIIRHAQRRSEKLASQQRRNVLRMDAWIEDALAFTGAELPPHD
jgi:preprotein translocase subunit SecA